MVMAVFFSVDGYAIGTYGSIGTLTNTGSITNTNIGIRVFSGGSIGILTNGSSGVISGGSYGIYGDGTIGALNNSGTISGDSGIRTTSSITTLINSGTISGAVGWGLRDSGAITTLTNTGNISGVQSDIRIDDVPIVTLNNLQSNLRMQYGSPTNYNIIIRSPSSFGKLAITDGVGGPTTFGIYTGSTVANHSYAAVLSGLGLNSSYATYGYLTALSGSYGSATWLLTPEAACTFDCTFDLTVSGYYSGPSTANTQQSLINTAQALQSTYALQNSVIANSFSYDCTEFGANGICISAGGRNTAVSAANGLNNVSALLIAAYRPHQNYRVGAYVDQNLSVNNAGSTVNLGNNTPLIGFFGAWNERVDGTGTEVKVSAAYGQKYTTINRGVVGTGDAASEAGTGGSKLNSQGAQVTAKYGFGIADRVIVSPYVGIRYTQNNMGGYTEATSTTVAAPLTYGALNTNATTALAGVGASYRGIPQTTLFASAGIETDTNTTNGTYAGNNAYFAGGLTPVNFNANPVKTRPTASLGAYYDVVKNQRIGVAGIYRQEAYQAVSTTTVMAAYTVGL